MEKCQYLGGLKDTCIGTLWKFPEIFSIKNRSKKFVERSAGKFSIKVRLKISNQTLIEKFQPDFEWKKLIKPWFEFFNRPYCPCLKNFNHDHDLSWKPFANQPDFDFYFSIAITFFDAHSQNRYLKNSFFRRWMIPVFLPIRTYNQSAEWSHFDLKFSIDPTTPAQNFFIAIMIAFEKCFRINQTLIWIFR